MAKILPFKKEKKHKKYIKASLGFYLKDDPQGRTMQEYVDSIPKDQKVTLTFMGKTYERKATNFPKPYPASECELQQPVASLSPDQPYETETILKPFEPKEGET
jgi:hypothetical protein